MTDVSDEKWCDPCGAMRPCSCDYASLQRELALSESNVRYLQSQEPMRSAILLKERLETAQRELAEARRILAVAEADQVVAWERVEELLTQYRGIIPTDVHDELGGIARSALTAQPASEVPITTSAHGTGEGK